MGKQEDLLARLTLQNLKANDSFALEPNYEPLRPHG